jgi:acyl carrier protein
MNREEIQQKVAGVLAESLNIERNKIQPQANLQADLGAESIDLLELLFRLEQEFGIKIRDEELCPPAMMTVGMITNYVGNKLKGIGSQEA